MNKKSGLMHGTLDMLILRVLSREKLHGLGITRRLLQVSKQALEVEEGSLYPALYRMQARGWLTCEWAITENGQRAKYYSLSKKGQKQLAAERKDWERLTSIVGQVMGRA